MKNGFKFLPSNRQRKPKKNFPNPNPNFDLSIHLILMEPPNQNDEDDCFVDALDDFPFHDCTVTDQSAHSTSTSTLSEPTPYASSPASVLRRRRSISRRSPADLSSATSSDTAIVNNPETSSREKRIQLYRDLKGNEKNLESTESARSIPYLVDSSAVASVLEEAKDEESTVTTANDDRVADSVDSPGELGESTDMLVFMAGLVIKAIGFQVNLFVYFITFPLWVFYHCYMLVVDPFGAIRRGKEFIVQKLVSLMNFIGGICGSFIDDWLKEHKTIWKLLMQFGWGLFWSCYVSVILCGLLVFSVMLSGFLMRYLVEEPMQIKQDLNFDYTKNSPVAFVPIKSCGGVACGLDCKENIGDVKSLKTRVIPPNHKLQVSVLLTLPESDYNRNLGVFQIRVDFLSADGKTLASKSHPCILKFKSEPVRILLTFLKVAPVIAGYVSESQTLELKIKGFTEGDVPTSCLKVIIEQRAEYRPGAGIPEIYDASVILESELPLLKRIIWCWKKTIFVWISLVLFMMELLLALVCCRSVIIPRARLRDDSIPRVRLRDDSAINSGSLINVPAHN